MMIKDHAPEAAALLRRGETQAAIDLLSTLPTPSLTELNYLADGYFQSRQWDKSLMITRDLLKQGHRVNYNRLVEIKLLTNSKRYQEAITAATSYLSDIGPDIDLLDVLKVANFNTGELKAARKYGQMAITEKERVGAPHRTPPKIHPGTGTQDIIAYSVWGDNKSYTIGAAINILHAAKFFPGWQVRIYTSSRMDPSLVQLYRNLGADVVLADLLFPQVPTYFWRFLVMNDPDTRYFLCRDADCRLSAEEASVVSGWLSSKKKFHVMRDHILHNDLILAGMWGGVGTGDLDITALMDSYFKGKPTNKYGHDQKFLGKMVWPLIKTDTFVHDRFYRTTGTTSHKHSCAMQFGDGYQCEEDVLKEAAALGISRTDNRKETIMSGTADPLVSVILPVYNAALYVSESLDSLLAQTYQNFEIIAVDDGSTDGSGAILDEYASREPRLKVFHLEQNQGEGKAVQFAWQQARGELHARMDSDDICRPDRLAQQVAFLSANPGIIVVGSNMEMFGTQTGMTNVPTADPQIKAHMVIARANILNPTSMWRARWFREKGVSYGSQQLAPDYETWVDCMLAGGTFANLPDSLVKYRIHGKQASTQSEALNRCVQLIMIKLISHWYPRFDAGQTEALASICHGSGNRSLPAQVVIHAMKAAEIAKGDSCSRYGEDRTLVAKLISKQVALWQKSIPPQSSAVITTPKVPPIHLDSTGIAIPDIWQREAENLWNADQKQQAFDILLGLINRLAPQRPLHISLQFCYYLFLIGDVATGEMVLRELLAFYPDEPMVLENLAVMLNHQQKYLDAIPYLQKVTLLQPESANCWDALANCSAGVGDYVTAREAGNRSLQIKDSTAAPLPDWQLPDVTPAEFLTQRPNNHIIAFSLWGTGHRYLRGALRNLLLVPELYPGWKARFYIDGSVPSGFADLARELGAEVVIQPDNQQLRQKLCWRFQVANDPTVGRFMVRDCDSVVCQRECRAVAQWLQSDRYFHGMRDWWSHTDPVLAGMWGGVAGVLPDLTALLTAYAPQNKETANVDQWFLRDCLWDALRRSLLVHDRCYTSGFGQPWPDPTPEGSYHVGQNEYAVRRTQQEIWLKPWLDRYDWLMA